ncbi:hypothetical protein HNY73_012215 [Argiope bruennichi]|uniref:Uncharacterized protein n=1 Tax=Argiope bruennichi TaxID=94029 RepID=A0A8T0EZW2_ARGBR|nr:hypothetical protein HNY73_012215 [Argiope bruennichi]
MNWNDEFPETLASQWKYFVDSMKFIEELHIDRYIFADAIKKTILGGFAVSSQVAYGAAVYVKSISETNSIVI